MNLLDLARMQSEGVRLNREWLMLDEIVGSALAHSAGVLAGRDVSTDLPADLPLIDVDALLIERVLMNLLDNAAKYAGTDAAVAVRARVFGETLYVFVEDDGPGFIARNTEPLFEPFERERKESSISGVASRAVPQHRQRARRLDPRGAARSARRAVRDSPAPGRAARYRTREPDMIRSRVLIVEDESDIRRFVRMALEQEGPTPARRRRPARRGCMRRAASPIS